MSLVFLSTFSGVLLGWLMGFLSLFLILLVLVQRGRGGGLTGALGGPGGQSAFGSKAGDTFTIITVVVAAIWGFVCAFTMWLLGTHAPAVADTPPALISPADDEIDTETITIPSGDSLGLGGLSAGGAADEDSAEDDGAAATDTMQLAPASGGDDDGESEDAEATGENDAADDVSSVDEIPSADEDSDPTE